MNEEEQEYKMPDGTIIKTTYKKAMKKWQSGKYGLGFEEKNGKM